MRYSFFVNRIYLFGLLSFLLTAADAPPGLVRLAAERESKTEDVRSKYLYKQVVLFQEIGKSGMRGGEYREQREVIFSPGENGRNAWWASLGIRWH